MRNYFICIVFGALSIFFSGDAIAQCDDSHSTNWEDAWLSCTTSENPNSQRPDGHWIMYDMGDIYALYTTKIWNYNVSGETGKGVRNCYFDVSDDGINWELWGSMEIPEAPGDDGYEGVPGPDLGGISGRYLLLTIDSNWDSEDPCSGFAEIKVYREYLGVGVEDRNEIILELYPNPSNSVLNLRHYQPGNLDLTVVNMNGRLVHSETMTRTTHSMDVSNWASGLYVLILRDDRGRSATKRFVVSP